MTSAATVIAAPASCTGVGTIPESADTAKAATGTTFMNSTPFTGVMILLPIFQLSTAMAPATSDM